MTSLTVCPKAFAAMSEAAASAYPTEACGLVTGHRDAPDSWQVHPFENLQDRLHADDPERFPRDGRTAFAMNPLKVQRLVDRVEAAGQALIAIFHSHPDHPSYFSKTDIAAAMPFGTPSFPDASQLVISVFDGEVCDVKGFHWSHEAQRWDEIPLLGLPPLPGPPPGARPLGDV